MCFLDQGTADFSAGFAGTATYLSQTSDGEVILSRRPAPSSLRRSCLATWQAEAWGGGSTPPVGVGLLTVDGGHAPRWRRFGSGRSLEFVATFRGEVSQHVGFTKNYAFDSPWAIFSTFGSTTTLYARVNPGGDVSLGTGYLGVPHRYRIDWNPSNVVFSVDGSVVATVPPR